jgi:hypothetical protein
MRKLTEKNAERISNWVVWTALVLVIVSAILSLPLRSYPTRPLPAGLNRTVALQLPHFAADIAIVLDNPQGADSQTAAQIMLMQQYLDMGLYIPAYVAFFLAAGFLLIVRKRGGWKLFGWAAIGLVVVCAVVNYAQDITIVHAIKAYEAQTLSDADANRILPWGVAKWILLYAALFCLSPLPVDRWRSQLLRFAGVLISFYAAFSGISGITGALLKNGVRVSSSTGGLIAMVVFFFPLYALARNGLVAGLDVLARSRLLSWLAAWTEYGKRPIVIPDLVPEPVPQTRAVRVRQQMLQRLSSSLAPEAEANGTERTRPDQPDGASPEGISHQ